MPIDPPQVDRPSLIATARRVIRREADALGLLADAVGDPFADAIALMLRAEGRVIVSGMGKSGHVARKIAAPLPRPAHRRISSIRPRRATATWAC